MAHPPVVDLGALAEELLADAAAASNGRASRTVTGGAAAVLRHTALALRAGQELPEHASPGEATLQVLRGRVVVRSAGSELAGATGALLALPAAPHAVAALEDSVLLLTVAKAP